MSHDHHDTVVVDDRGGSSMGAILGIIAIIVLLGAVWYFALGPGAAAPAGSGGSTTPAQTQEAPVPTDAPAAS